ncbi:hypothetical protein L915_09637 [Phytophthora nicotianae]|nr:hypothetical protein L915_09637 [Phytophthora nicotianae]
MRLGHVHHRAIADLETTKIVDGLRNHAAKMLNALYRARMVDLEALTRPSPVLPQIAEAANVM